MTVKDGRLFTCAACSEEFLSGWTEEESIAEMQRQFGDLQPDQRQVVCDDCYRAMQAQGLLPLFPEQVVIQ